MALYEDFILENTAPVGVKMIGVYNKNGLRVGHISLGNLLKDKGRKLYSFGALSDVHLQYDTAQEDFQRALAFLNETEEVAFTCIAGDLTVNGTDAELQAYRTVVENYSPNTPVYAISGNHEVRREADLPDVIEQYTGYPLYYSFTRGNDVFIMLGIKGESEGKLFTTEELQWLYDTLEANRDKRCFIFEHVNPQDSCGNAMGIYNYDIWGGTEATVFESLLKHYHNVILFHGHSHLKFYLQYLTDKANYDHSWGFHSVHIPSLSVPRDGDASGASSRKEVYADSEGYVVDVYENGVHLRGRDFVKGEYLPIASYWLDTTLKTVETGTFTDSTGTIYTG